MISPGHGFGGIDGTVWDCSGCTISFSGVHAVTFSTHCSPTLSAFDSTFTSMHRLPAEHGETDPEKQPLCPLLLHFSVSIGGIIDYQITPGENPPEAAAEGTTPSATSNSSSQCCLVRGAETEAQGPEKSFKPKVNSM